MKIAITGASGFIGRRLMEKLGKEAYAVSLRGNLDGIAGADVVINLAGEPVSQRWTKEVREKIRSSRVDGTKKLVDAMRAAPPKVLVNASAVGYYGSRGDELLIESSAPADDFLAEVCQEWEAEARNAGEFGVRVVTLRNGVVLGKGGALQKMMLPFRLGAGGRIGDGKQWMAWIHLDDVVGLIELAIFHLGLSGPVNATAPNPVTNAEFTRALGHVFRGYMSRKHNRRPRRCHGNLLVRKYAVLLIRAGAHVHVHAQVEAARPLQFVPDDERDLSGRLAMHQNLRGCNDLGKSNGRVGDGDTLQLFGRVDEQRLAHHHPQRRRPLRLRLRRKRGGLGSIGRLALGRSCRGRLLHHLAKPRHSDAHRQYQGAQQTRANFHFQIPLPVRRLACAQPWQSQDRSFPGHLASGFSSGNLTTSIFLSPW